MKRTWFALSVVCLATLAFVPVRHKLFHLQSSAPRSAPPGSVAANGELFAAYGKVPLTFETNQGQTDERVKFLARGHGYTVFLAGSEATLLLQAPSSIGAASSFVPSGPAGSAQPSSQPAAAIRLALAGASPGVEVEPLDLQPGASNYLIGNDPAKWHRNVPHFARVKLHGVYPGVDLDYYGNQGQLESDYVVAPGASPRQIGLRIEGADKLHFDPQGNLVLATPVGEVTLHCPRAYQQIAGSRREIAANYTRRGPRVVGMDVASYDATQPLIIDPVLSYSTYLGGSANQSIAGIAADPSGFAYVTGVTSSTNFPTVAGSLQTTLSNSSGNAFITKLKQDGTGLVYSTFLGGTGATGDSARAIAVDSAGDAYIVGFTSSSDFPLKGGSAFQTVNKGGGGFFTKLDPAGATLLYSTYLNGSGTDRLNAIAIDSGGDAYITGSTTSTDFPTVVATALQNTNNVTGSQIGTAFLSRIDPSQSGAPSLVYSTYLGGSKEEAGLGVAVDSAFDAYVVGSTSSANFPQPAVKNGFQTALSNTSGNAFVARISTTQPALLVYSTYLGGTPSGGSSPGDVGTSIAVPAAGGLVYITGYTYAADFPTVAPLDTHSNTPFQKAFIAQLDTAKTGGASLPYSSYFGGTVFSVGSTEPGADLGFGIALDSLKNIYVAGTTSSADFPVTPGAPQPTKIGTQNAFLSELNPTGSAVLFSTYLGGSNDAASSVALDTASPANAYIAGTTSGNFPTTVGAFQTVDAVSGASNNDGFVAKLSPGTVSTGVFASPAFVSFGNQIVHTPSSAKTVTLFNHSASVLSTILITFTGADAADFTEGTSTCAASLASNASCTIEVIFTPSKTSAESAVLNITDSDSTSPQTVALTGNGTAAPAAVFLAPTTLDFGNQTINETSAAKTVTLTNNSAATLSNIVVTIGGASPTLFAKTTTCGATLAIGASCTISVTFTPTAAAAVTATLDVADSDAGSPQTATLSGTGSTSNPDFTVTVSAPTASVAAGGTANITVTVTGLNGFTSPVALACAGAPAGASCVLTPSTVTPSSTGANATAAVATTMRAIAAPTVLFRTWPHGPIATWPVALGFLLLAAWLSRRQAPRKLAWAVALLAVASLAGCSGLPHHGTPAGVYTLTITGAAGTQTHQVTVSLTVT